MNDKSVIIFTLILVMVITGSSLSSFALSGSSTEYGSLNIDKDIVSISEFESTIIQISGNVIDYHSGQKIILELIKPDNTSIEIKTQANNEGIFSIPLILDSNWLSGNYQLSGTFLNNEIGSASFLITSVPTTNIPIFANIGSLEIDNEEITLSGNKKSTVEINGNIKNYQKGDLISLKIIHPDGLITDVSITGKSTGDFKAHVSIEESWKSGTFSIIASYEGKDFGQVNFLLNKIQIPEFFKNVAYWWSDGLIGDSEFVDGVEFLINEKIIDFQTYLKVQQVVMKIPLQIGFVKIWVGGQMV
ncbi:MAG: hypothetical protein HRO68_07250 [Nitrosopumilus sp.]|nr:hypothetical protein [Nitrosopumilus sp.]